MDRIALIAAALALAGCVGHGPTGPDDSTRFEVDGVGASAAHVSEASRMFDQVRMCADAPTAEPRGVKVHLVQPAATGAFPTGQAAIHCPAAPSMGLVGGCSTTRDLWVLDWHAGPSWSESFGHEAVHLARSLVSGDPDTGHAGPWWVGGKSCQSSLLW